jgi:hypothetical protein
MGSSSRALIFAALALAPAAPLLGAPPCGLATRAGSVSLYGDARKQTLQVTFTAAAGGISRTTLSLDCNGDNDFDDTSLGDLKDVIVDRLEILDVQLKGNDTISLAFAAGQNFDGDSKSIQILLGPGTNTVTLGSGVALLSNSKLLLDVVGGSATDVVNLQLQQLLAGITGASALDFRIDTGLGNDQLNVALPGLGQGSSLDLHASLGPGTNSFNLTSALNISDSTATIEVEGGVGVDTVNASFGADLINNSRVLLSADLLAGNDTFTANVDLANVDIQAGSELRLKARGGAGIDTLRLTRNGTTGGSRTLAGILDVDFAGGAGNDVLDVDLGAGGFVTSGSLRIQADGGANNDTLTATVEATSSGTPTCDLAFTGGSGNDKLTFAGAFNGATAGDFGPAGTVVIDGGSGIDTCSAPAGGIPLPPGRSGDRALTRNCEL